MTDTPSTTTTDDEAAGSSAEDASGLEDATNASSNDQSTDAAFESGPSNPAPDVATGDESAAGATTRDGSTRELESGDGSTGDEAADESVTLERGADAFGPDSEIRRYLAWGGLGVCSLVALVGLFQFYGSVAAVIDIWVAPKYEPVARAAFNLAVLLVGIAGVSWSVRELSSNSRP